MELGEAGFLWLDGGVWHSFSGLCLWVGDFGFGLFGLCFWRCFLVALRLGFAWVSGISVWLYGADFDVFGDFGFGLCFVGLGICYWFLGLRCNCVFGLRCVILGFVAGGVAGLVICVGLCNAAFLRF